MAGYMEYKNSGIPWIGDIPAHWDIKRGKNILSLLDRPVRADDEVITCFRDGEVTLRKNRREDGFTVSLQEVGYQGIEPGDLVVHGMDGFAGSVGVSDSRGKATPVLNVLDSAHNKRYLMYYLRMAAYKDVFLSLSTGIRVRSCDLRWNKLAVFPFILPERAEQDKIVEYIDRKLAKIDVLIAEAKASIEEYKAWKASIIYEAVTKGLDPNATMKDSGIEWIGTVPTGWKLPRIKDIAIFMPKCDFSICTSETPITFTPMECIRTGTFENRSKLFGEIEGTYTQYAEGDIVLAKVTPCFENGNVCIMKQLHSGVGMGSSELFVLRPTQIHDRYLLYVLQHSGFKDAACATMTGTGGLKRVSSSFIQNCHIPYPAISVQKRIADYLDDKCSSISDLIAEKETLITDLEAYKKSLIFEVVTGKRKAV